jgi:hypothetical protein
MENCKIILNYVLRKRWKNSPQLIFKSLSQHFVQKLRKTSVSAADLRVEFDLALPTISRRGQHAQGNRFFIIITLKFIVYLIKLETVFTIMYW